MFKVVKESFFSVNVLRVLFSFPAPNTYNSLINTATTVTTLLKNINFKCIVVLAVWGMDVRITDDKRFLLNVFNEIKFIAFDDVVAFYVAKVLVLYVWEFLVSVRFRS